MRVAFKPTSTIARRQNTVSREGQDVELLAKGRHDPCVVPRAVPMVEAMVAITLADQLLQVARPAPHACLHFNAVTFAFRKTLTGRAESLWPRDARIQCSTHSCTGMHMPQLCCVCGCWIGTGNGKFWTPTGLSTLTLKGCPDPSSPQTALSFLLICLILLMNGRANSANAFLSWSSDFIAAYGRHKHHVKVFADACRDRWLDNIGIAYQTCALCGVVNNCRLLSGCHCSPFACMVVCIPVNGRHGPFPEFCIADRRS